MNHRSVSVRRWRIPMVAIVALLCVGCGDAVPTVCARPNTEEPVDFRGGEVENGVFMSSAWDGEFLFFPGGAYYRIHHQLDAEPRWWHAYLSFERNGLSEGSVALAVGNQAELKGLDDESLTLLNGSCVDYWLLVVAGDGSLQPAGGGSSP